MDSPSVDGNSVELTVNDAAEKYAGLLSGLEDSADDEYEASPDETPEASQDERPADDENDAAEEDAAEEGTEDEPKQPVSYRVKINGQEVEVPLPELLAGYSRTADYTRKTQELAAQRKQHEQELAAVRAERQEYAQSLAKLRAALESVEAEPDWARLRQESPEEFAATYAAWQQHKERLAAVEAEQRRVHDLQQQELQRQLAEYVKQEQEKLLAAIPEWKDSKVATAEKQALVEYAQGLGFTDEELAQVVDHRAVTLLRKAYLYDKQQAAKPLAQKKVAAAKAVAPGSGGQFRRQTSEATKAKQRLAKTGRVKDAAAVLLALDD